MTHLKRVPHAGRLIQLFVACLLALTVSSCGDSGDRETVFLFVINGYAGAESIDVYGPTGPIVQALAFGDRTPEPVEINRASGTDFIVVIKGTPTPIELEFNLFAMYPQETATLFVKKRSSVESAAVSLYRHIQTIDPYCALTFENGLSVGNDFLTVGSFSFAPEFNLGTAEAGGYFDEAQEQVFTECGPLPLPTLPPIPRPNLKAAVDANPYFFLVDCQIPSGATRVCPVAARLEDDTGEVIGFKPTSEYFQCVQQAITIKQPEGAMPSPFPPADSQVQCPDGALTWDDVQVDAAAVEACKGLTQYNTRMLNPADGQETYSISPRPPPLSDDFSGTILGSDDGLVCNVQFRVRTPAVTTIFGPEPGSSTPGEHGVGAYTESTISIPVGAEHFWVLFGRPVNPLVWQWNSSENFVDLNEFPYLNDQNQGIDRDAFDSEPQ